MCLEPVNLEIDDDDVIPVLLVDSSSLFSQYSARMLGHWQRTCAEVNVTIGVLQPVSDVERLIRAGL